MIEKINSTIKKYDMLKKDEYVVLGLSGGSDSVALAFVLKNLGFMIRAVHINHNLRENEALRDENFCVEFCKKLDVPVDIYNVNVKDYALKYKITLEEAGRHIRYNLFDKTLQKINAHKIAVAHNYNDNIETILMNIFRGSGLSGISGIPPVRNNIVRPLIECAKEEIDNFCNKNNLDYIIDSSNLETDYMRNKIRLELLPYLKKEINVNVEKNIKRFSYLSQIDNDYIEHECKKAFDNLVKIFDNKAEIDIKKFNLYNDAIKQRVIRKAYECISSSLKDFNLKHCKLILNLAEKNTGKIINLPNKILAETSYGKLIIKKDIKKSFINIKLYNNCLIKIPDTPYSISLSADKELEKENYINTCTISLNYDTILNGIFLRNRKFGDKLHGKNKKLKDYFIDNKISREKRDEMLVISDEFGNIFCLFDEKFNTEFIFNKHSKDSERKIYIKIWEEN